MKKLVLFGAGKIGRSFIGQIFSRGGYEVVFIDIFEDVVNELNKKNVYKVIIKGNNSQVIEVKNVRAVLGTNTENVIKEIVSADLLALSVGQAGLPHILPTIGKALIERYQANKNLAIDIIIAENMRDSDIYIKNELIKILPENYPFNNLIGLVETSIGKMVPIMKQKDIEEDMLQVFAEAYNTLPIDGKAFKNSIPDVPGLAPKENMKAWVDRKSFIHNFGHAATAYAAYVYNNDFTYIYEALEIKEIQDSVRSAMLQSGDVLREIYPSEFTEQDIIDHVDDLIRRFKNKALGDTIYRVGCDLYRKLGPEDRVVGVLKIAFDKKKKYDHILQTLINGLKFKATDEYGKMFPKDVEFHKEMEKGNEHILTKVCGLKADNHHKIIKNVIEYFK